MWASVVVGLALASSSALGLKARINRPTECPSVEPPRPVHGCYWVPVRDEFNGCLLHYNFRCLDPKPEECGGELLAPARRSNCAYISLHDSKGCIVDFECEPEDCPAVADPTDVGCAMIPLRGPDHCVQEFLCVPVPPQPLANSERVGPMRNMGSQEPAAFALDDVEAFSEPEPAIPELEPAFKHLEPEAEPEDDHVFHLEDRHFEQAGDFQSAPVSVASEDPAVAKTEGRSAKVLKDSVLFSGIKPGLGFGPPLPARPILAARPALAVQPIVPARAPPPPFAPLPALRPPFLPRVAPVAFPVRRAAFVGCAPPPPRPLDTNTCLWTPVMDRRRCIRQWECDPVPREDDTIKCPRAPVRPDVGDRCNWIPVMDKNNCIRKYECEPIPPAPCPPAPLPPNDHDRCRWISIKDANGCILDYECVPIRSHVERAGAVLGGLGGDRNKVCCWWAMKGECENNFQWMRSNCPLSCSRPGCQGGFLESTCVIASRRAGCPFPL